MGKQAAVDGRCPRSCAQSRAARPSLGAVKGKRLSQVTADHTQGDGSQKPEQEFSRVRRMEDAREGGPGKMGRSKVKGTEDGETSV